MLIFFHHFNRSFRWHTTITIILFTVVYHWQVTSAGNVKLRFPDEQLQPDSRLEVNFFGNVAEKNRLNSSATHSKVLKRDKRYLLWTNGGISKLVLGMLTPVETKDRVNWRTLNMAYNWQAQYVPLPSAQYIWGKFTRDLISRRRRFDESGIFEKDTSRLFIYRAIELFLNSRGKNGKHCLLKAICEAAEYPIEATGIFDHILHLTLTPNKDDSDSEYDVYVNARLAGENGGDCRKMYLKCPNGDGLLDRISFLL